MKTTHAFIDLFGIINKHTFFSVVDITFYSMKRLNIIGSVMLHSELSELLLIIKGLVRPDDLMLLEVL